MKGRLRDTFHQDQPEGRGDHQSGQNRGQQRVGQEAYERIQQHKPVVLQQNEQGQRNTGVVHHQFARPRLAGVPVSEVDKGHGEQGQAHRRQNSDAATPLAQRRCSHGHHGQYQESHGDHQEGCLMESRSIARDFPKMHDDRRRAQRVARAHERRPGALKRRVQQDSGQKAEHGETRRHYQVQDRRGQSGPGQNHQGSQVPSQGEARRKPRQIASLHSGPSPAAVQKNQENGEDQGAGRMPENIDQQRLVQSEHGRRQFRWRRVRARLPRASRRS